MLKMFDKRCLLQTFRKYNFVLVSLFTLFLAVQNFSSVIQSKNSGFSVEGMPISDTASWSACAQSLSHYGVWPTNIQNWCFRRPLYSIFLGSLLRILPNENYFLLFVNFVFSVSLLTLLWFLKKHSIPFLYLIFISFLINRIWLAKAANQFSTEQFGILFSLIGVTLVYIGLVRPSVTYVLTGILLLSFSQVARPGNVFLPIAISVLVLTFFTPQLKLYLSFSFMVVAPTLLLKLHGQVLNEQAFSGFGNSWVVLYGFSSGNRDWTAAYTDFQGMYQTDEELFSLAKTRSIANILSNPGAFVSNIASNFLTAADTFTETFASFLPTNSLLVVLFFVILSAVYLLFLDIRNYFGVTLGLLAIFVTEIVFNGLTLKSDFTRTMSSSYPVLIAIIPILLLKVRTGFYRYSAIALKEIVLLPFFLTIILILTFTVYWPTRTVETANCPKDFSAFQVIRQLSTPRLDVGEDSYWWEDAVHDLPKGMLFQGFIYDSRKINYRQFFFEDSEMVTSDLCVIFDEGGVLNGSRDKLDANLKVLNFELASQVLPLQEAD